MMPGNHQGRVGLAFVVSHVDLDFVAGVDVNPIRGDARQPPGREPENLCLLRPLPKRAANPCSRRHVASTLDTPTTHRAGPAQSLLTFIVHRSSILPTPPGAQTDTNIVLLFELVIYQFHQVASKGVYTRLAKRRVHLRESTSAQATTLGHYHYGDS
ncbi:hypothetical protein CHU98_g1895 [Xylaria longipes]|nr:hypothetical protein CHU98_g1895 [Xylaria longipes]